MGHRELTQLKQGALDKVIFHMTPKQWITESGPWVLDRGDGALLYDVEVGVRSRRELVARVFLQHYAPRLETGATIGSDGSFLSS